MTGRASAAASARGAAQPQEDAERPGAATADPELTAALVAALLSVDPSGLGGVVLRSAAGPARQQWLAQLQALQPPGTPWKAVPLHAQADRLSGGLDLAATLHAGRPVAQSGLLAQADGGWLLLAMAERLPPATATAVTAVLDTQVLVLERDGLGQRSACRIGVVALDEGIDDDEQTPARLRERLAFHLRLPQRSAWAEEAPAPLWRAQDIAQARQRLPQVHLDDALMQSLCAAALALGVDSLRAPTMACRAARAVAALDGRQQVSADDAALAAGLVLAPRATRLPAAEEEAPAEPEPPPPEPPEPPPPSDKDDPPDDAPAQPQGPLDEVVLQAALASMPPGLLALLSLGPARSARAQAAGRAGAQQMGPSRGRPVGVRRGLPGGGARLNLIETLRCAAPWQPLRRREAAAAGQGGGPQVRVRRDDFRLWRFKQRSETTTVFVVDASGSAALHRLAEAKGAVELLLADCYVRRDSVAVIAFRGAGAELLLPPTRSLVRAKRSLAGLPGGGGTPLAAGIDAALDLSLAVRRRGATPVVVLLTDGRANIARGGAPGRAQAAQDARAAARQMHAQGVRALVLDTSPQPQEAARQLAADMGARYLPLPHAGATLMSQAVRQAGAAG